VVVNVTTNNHPRPLIDAVEKGGDLDTAGWSGIHADSWSTATVVRLTDDHAVVVGYAVS
jgi:hypothetical protein